MQSPLRNLHWLGVCGGAGDAAGAIHFSHQPVEHLFSLVGLALQVAGDALLALCGHDVHPDGTLLTEAPAATDGLVVLLEAVRWEGDDVGAVLEIQAPCADLWLRDQHPRLAVSEGRQAVFLCVLAVAARHLHGIWDQPFEHVTFVVQVAPHQRRLPGVVHQIGHALAAFFGSAPEVRTACRAQAC